MKDFGLNLGTPEAEQVGWMCPGVFQGNLPGGGTSKAPKTFFFQGEILEKFNKFN